MNEHLSMEAALSSAYVAAFLCIISSMYTLSLPLPVLFRHNTNHTLRRNTIMYTDGRGPYFDARAWPDHKQIMSVDDDSILIISLALLYTVDSQHLESIS